MGVVESIVANLTPWTRSRPSNPADVRHMIGSWAAMSVLQYFVIERIAVIAWIEPKPDPEVYRPEVLTNYNYGVDFISDLGARGCHIQDDGSPYARWICSPLFALTDFSFLVLGIGVIAAALLITSTVLRVGGDYETFQKEDRLKNNPKDSAGTAHEDTKDAQSLKLLVRHIGGEHYGRKLRPRHVLTFFVRFFMFLTGVALLCVGSFPEDYDQSPIHAWSTGAFLVCAVLTLVPLGFVWWNPRRVAAVALFVAAAAATIGGLALLATIWWDLKSVPRGMWERFVIYAFILGVAIMGFTLARGASRMQHEKALSKARDLSASHHQGTKIEAHVAADPPQRVGEPATRARIFSLNGLWWVGLIDIQHDPPEHP